TYAGRLTISMTGDADALPDLERLIAAVGTNSTTSQQVRLTPAHLHSDPGGREEPGATLRRGRRSRRARAARGTARTEPGTVATGPLWRCWCRRIVWSSTRHPGGRAGCVPSQPWGRLFNVRRGRDGEQEALEGHVT